MNQKAYGRLYILLMLLQRCHQSCTTIADRSTMLTQPRWLWIILTCKTKQTINRAYLTEIQVWVSSNLKSYISFRTVKVSVNKCNQMFNTFFYWLFNLTLWMFYSALCENWSMLHVHKHTKKSLEENTFIGEGRKILCLDNLFKAVFELLNCGQWFLMFLHDSKTFQITVSKQKSKLPCHVILMNTVSNLDFEIQMVLS